MVFSSWYIDRFEHSYATSRTRSLGLLKNVNQSSLTNHFHTANYWSWQSAICGAHAKCELNVSYMKPLVNTCIWNLGNYMKELDDTWFNIDIKQNSFHYKIQLWLNAFYMSPDSIIKHFVYRHWIYKQELTTFTAIYPHFAEFKCWWWRTPINLNVNVSRCNRVWLTCHPGDLTHWRRTRISSTQLVPCCKNVTRMGGRKTLVAPCYVEVIHPGNCWNITNNCLCAFWSMYIST